MHDVRVVQETHNSHIISATLHRDNLMLNNVEIATVHKHLLLDIYILQLQLNWNYLASGNSTLRVIMAALFVETSTRGQDFWVVKSGLTPVEMLLEILHYSLWLQKKHLDLILAQFLQCQIFQL